MARFTTIVAVIGPDAGPLVAASAHQATNVGAVRLEDFEHEDTRVRLRLAWSEAQRRKTIYTLTDFDPMQPVVDAWAARSSGGDHRLSLEVGLSERTELPEYVLITDDVGGETVHWYHGLLHGFASKRVLTVRRSPEAILGTLEHLRSDRAFPTADVVSQEALDFAPTRLSRSPEDGASDTATLRID